MKRKRKNKSSMDAHKVKTSLQRRKTIIQVGSIEAIKKMSNLDKNIEENPSLKELFEKQPKFIYLPNEPTMKELII